MREDRSRAGAKARWQANVMAVAASSRYTLREERERQRLLTEAAIARQLGARPRPAARHGLVIR